MGRGNAQLIPLLEERLRRLKGLSHAIEAAQQACISGDLEALRSHDGNKVHLCAEIRRLDQEICKLIQNIPHSESLRSVLAAHAEGESVDPTAARRLAVLFSENQQARAEVGRMNRVYGMFLVRSRNTMNVMINVVSHCLGVYPSLDSPFSPARPFERSY